VRDRLELVPCSVQDARAFVLEHHRHHPPPLSGLFALAAPMNGVVVAVAIADRSEPPAPADEPRGVWRRLRDSYLGGE
jgi:hypothetical protein